MIESTGVAAIGVHGRTKDERPGQACHDDIIREVVQVGREANSFKSIESLWNNGLDTDSYLFLLLDKALSCLGQAR